jgi:hypothetical protein
MMQRTKTQAWIVGGVLLVGSGAACAVSSDEDPSVEGDETSSSGQGGATAATSIGSGPSGPSGGFSTGAGTTTGGAGDCASCADVYSGAMPPNELCTDDGAPSSADRFDDFMQCACVSTCPSECQDACAGTAAPDQTCQGCVDSGCGAQIQACVGSTASGGSTGSGMGPGCTTCAAAYEGTGDPANLCPGSEPLFNDFMQCACGSGCPAQCGTPCAGQGPPDAACQGCIDTTCATEVQACVADM